MNKLKFVKEKLRFWKRHLLGDNKIRKSDILQELEGLDKIESDSGFMEDHYAHRLILRNELDEIFNK